jgi:hypothetical protein
MWDLWPVIILGVAVAYFMLRFRETFVIKYGNPSDDEDLLSFDRDGKGTRLFSTTPDTCPLDKSDLDAGLCYPPCEGGYHGVGPVCWADTVNIGIGRIAKLLNCAESGYGGWNDWGLVCHQPIKCATGLAFFREGCSGGNVRAKKLSCDAGSEHPDFIAGLCYRKCPADKPAHLGGMPYLCFKGTRGLSYGRGVGTVPPLFHFGA